MAATVILAALLVLSLVDRERGLGVYRAEVKRLHDRIDARDRAHAAERTELLTRVQHPEIVQLPPAQLEAIEQQTPEADEFDLVGTINMLVPDNDPDQARAA